jgi:acyl-CoA synthetase (AMP-forming)/AMP-acid ligase II
MNIAHLLLGAAQEFRDITALARGDAIHLGYRDLWRKVSVMSTHLSARFGLSRGDRVAFAMTNCVESIEVMYAIWHAGLCAVPMNAKLHAKEFAFILENSGARLCFVTPDLAATLAEAAKEAPALKEIVDVSTRTYTFMEVGDPSPIADCEPTRRGCSTRRARPAGPRARCSAIATCWP